MGTGDLKVPHQQMADHRFSARQGINAAAGAIRRQLLAGWILRETGHHRDRRSTGLLEPLTSPEQSIGTTQASPAGTAAALFELNLQGLVRGHNRSDLQAEGGATALRHLQVPLGQLRLNAGIQQQPDPLAAHRLQIPITDGEAIEAVALHVMDARVAPVQRRTVHHIGMGDQATTGGGQQASTGQCITGKAPDLATDSGRHQHQHRKRGGIHPSTTASTCKRRSPLGSTETAVIAQRKRGASCSSCWTSHRRNCWGGTVCGQGNCRSRRRSFTSDIGRTGLRRGHPPGRP